MHEQWQEVLERVRGEVRRTDFRSWFEPLKPVHWHNGTVTLQVKDSEFQSWFVERYEETLRSALEKVFDKPMTVTYRVREPELFERRIPATPQLSLFRPEYTFDDFVVGPSNHMAYAAAKAAAERPGRAYNPLLIYGGTGLGKTHMLHAIGHQAMARNPRLRVLYITAETYFTDMMTSITKNSMEQFRVKYRDACDMLLVDDVHILSGKTRSQEEFFHTFNALHAARKQIVFTTDRFPQEIPKIEDRLKSRFEWGLIADISTPELETRVAILKNKAERMDIFLDDDVAMLIAQRVRDNVRELESCLQVLHLAAVTTGSEITVKLAQDKLKAYFRNQARKVTVEQIQRVVASRFGITEQELLSKSRKKNLTQPRHIAMYLSRRLTLHSFPEIGDKFGGRDHSSVLSATRKIEKNLKFDTHLSQVVEELEQRIKR